MASLEIEQHQPSNELVAAQDRAFAKLSAKRREQMMARCHDNLRKNKYKV